MDISKINLKKIPPERIRNFAIIAHIEHGKPTLLGILLEYKGTLIKEVKAPSAFPDPSLIKTINEPMINATIIVPNTYLGNMIKSVKKNEAFRYAMHVIGIQGINLDSEPGIKDMQEIVNTISSLQIPTIFLETSLPHRSIEVIAQAVIARGWHVSIGNELYSDALGHPESTAGRIAV